MAGIDDVESAVAVVAVIVGVIDFVIVSNVEEVVVCAGIDCDNDPVPDTAF